MRVIPMLTVLVATSSSALAFPNSIPIHPGTIVWVDMGCTHAYEFCTRSNCPQGQVTCAVCDDLLAKCERNSPARANNGGIKPDKPNCPAGFVWEQLPATRGGCVKISR